MPDTIPETEMIPIRVFDLSIDAENPRLGTPNVGPREALRLIAANQKEKLVALAEDIVKNGINPSEFPVVVPRKGGYTVLEGNRRIAALKVLENPEPLDGAVPPPIMSALRALNKQYLEAPIDTILCVVVKHRRDADHWIELKHGGGHGGAGTEKWGAQEKARYNARSGKMDFHLQALDWLEVQHQLTPQERERLHLTNFKRLLNTPRVREQCGVGRSKGEFVVVGEEKRVAKALRHVVRDLISGGFNVKKIYTEKDRIKYAENLPADVVVPPITQGDGAIGTTKPQPKRRAKTKRQPARESLIHSDCQLTIPDPRLDDIAEELRCLSLRQHKNAVSVLFRVFIELSADAYIVTRKLSVSVNQSLDPKIRAVLADLLSQQKLSDQQSKPVKHTLQGDSFLAPSVRMLNDYVHNQYVFPSADVLRSQWDSLQPFMQAIWSP